MNRVVLAAVGLLALAAAGTAGGSPLGGADVANGRGSAVPCPPGTTPPFPSFCATSPRDFRFAAASSLAGGVANGYFWQAATFCSAPGVCTTGSFEGRVRCVRATGKEATLGIEIERSDLPTHPPGEQVHVSVVDNGRFGDPLPDLLSLTFTLPIVEIGGQCLAVLPPAYQTVVEGDIRVQDGQLSGGV